jgi:hypothetical protein
MLLLTLPFRLAFLVIVTLLLASGLMRRVFAGIVISALIVASQHEQVLTAFAAAASEDSSITGLLAALTHFAGG